MPTAVCDLAVSSTTLANGVSLHYAEQGEPDGVPAIFLHGVTDSWRSFEHTLPYIPHSIHAFAVSQRGHGDSSRPDSGYTQRDFADDVVAFMDVQGIEKAVIVGHSMGSLTAQRFAIDYPQRCLGVVLLASLPSFRETLQEFVDTDVAGLVDPIDPQLAREFQESTVARPLSDDFLKTVVEESLKVPSNVWKAAFEEGLIAADHTAELGSIQAPTLIIWGDRDEMCSREGQDVLERGIPGARLVVIEGAAHAVHWDDPIGVASVVSSFINRLPA